MDLVFLSAQCHHDQFDRILGLGPRLVRRSKLAVVLTTLVKWLNDRLEEKRVDVVFVGDDVWWWPAVIRMTSDLNDRVDVIYCTVVRSSTAIMKNAHNL